MKKKHFTSLSIRFCYAYLFVILVFSTFFGSKWKTTEVLQWDRWGYYSYLPAVFIYHDISQMEFIDRMEPLYHPTGQENFRYGLKKHPETGKWCDKYSCGVAFCQLPFFLLTHAYVSMSKVAPADGYSAPYQLAIVLSSIVFVFLGLLVLRKILLRFFDEMTTTITLFLIGVGTNLLVYITNEPGMSHPYSFFLFALVLWLTIKWHENATWGNSVLLGASIGLITLIRPIDILISLIPIFYVSASQSSFAMKWHYINAHLGKVILVIIAGSLFLLPQLVYWKYITGHWVYYSYDSIDRFDFFRLRVWQGLFSYRKGWFVYTPLALLGFIGFLIRSKEPFFRLYRIPFFVFFIPMIYVVFSWHNWFYGWSFGCRALIQTLPILAPMMALCVQWLRQQTFAWRLIGTSVLSLLVLLNVFQSIQYARSILDGQLMNKDYYWRTFGKLRATDADRHYLDLQYEADVKNGW